MQIMKNQKHKSSAIEYAIATAAAGLLALAGCNSKAHSQKPLEIIAAEPQIAAKEYRIETVQTAEPMPVANAQKAHDAPGIEEYYAFVEEANNILRDYAFGNADDADKAFGKWRNSEQYARACSLYAQARSVVDNNKRKEGWPSDPGEQAASRVVTAFDNAYFYRINSLINQGNVGGAIVCLNEFESKRFDYTWLYETRAELEEQKGNKVDAIKDYMHAISIHKKDLEIERSKEGNESQIPLFEEVIEYLTNKIKALESAGASAETKQP